MQLCRALERHDATGNFRERALANYPGNARHDLNLCKTSERQAFMIGGCSRGDYETNKSCLRFDLIENAWE